jgi:hypothetical protein
MSPLWSDLAIAHAARAAAAARGLIDPPERSDNRRGAEAEGSVARASRAAARRPIRRPQTSFAL